VSEDRLGVSGREPEITQAGLRRLMETFYGRARADDLLGPVFAGAIQDWPPHLRAINAFWTAVMLGFPRYEGDAFAAHARLPLTPAMFDRWLALWAQATGEVFAPEPAAALRLRANRIADSLRAGMA
jgi:hemoglobin